MRSHRLPAVVAIAACLTLALSPLASADTGGPFDSGSDLTSTLTSDIEPINNIEPDTQDRVVTPQEYANALAQVDQLNKDIAKADKAVKKAHREAVAAGKAADEAQAVAKAARETANQASDQADAATEASRFAGHSATTSVVIANQSQEEVDNWARQTYVNGGIGTSSDWVFLEGIEQPPNEYLQTQGYLTSIANETTEVLTEAEQSLAYAQARQADAKNAQKTADAASTIAAEANADAQAANTQAQQLRQQANVKVHNAEAMREHLAVEMSNSTSLLATLTASGAPYVPISDTGCPESAPAGYMRGAPIDIQKLCEDSVAQAATPQAAMAIRYALRMLGAPYACEGVGRMSPYIFDCSSFVSRAYFEGAGVPTMHDGWAPTTREMVPWGGESMAWWLTPVSPDKAKPGDLVTYDTGHSDSRHVVMLLADGYMVHTGACEDGANVTTFWGFNDNAHGLFLGARRVRP